MSEDESEAGEERRLAKRGALMDVNSGIREAAALFSSASEPESAWEFMCECGDRDCQAQVMLTLVEFDALKADGERVLAAGHAVDRAASARTRARGLRDEAAALRAQAEQQTRRAETHRRQPDA